MEAEDWIAFVLFEKSGVAYAQDPKNAAAFLTIWILAELRERFEEETPEAIHLEALRKCLVWRLLSLDEPTLDHSPDEEACNEAGREILYAFLSTFRPDVLC